MSSKPIALRAADIRLEDYPYDNKTTGLRSWRRTLMLDVETGMSISVQRHPAGDSGRWHTHTCGHGMYVLSGVLDTDFGRYGAGSFVWFPEGMRMEHGTSGDLCDLIFIANKRFGITFD